MQGFHIRIRFRFLFVWNDAKISSWPPCVPITFGGSTPIIDKTDIVPNTFHTSSIILTVDKSLLYHSVFRIGTYPAQVLR